MRLSATLATLTAMLVIRFLGMDHTTAVADSRVETGAADNINDPVDEAVTVAVPY